MTQLDVIDFKPAARQVYGYSSAPYMGWLNYAFALLTVVGAKGEVSAREMAWLTNELMPSLGVPPELKPELFEFDYQNADLEGLIGQISLNALIDNRRLLLYDAIKMMQVEEFDPHQIDQVSQMATTLQVDSDVAGAMQTLVEMNARHHQMRDLIFSNPDILGSAVRKFRFKISEASPIASEIFIQADVPLQSRIYYAYALLVIVAADAPLTEGEANWLYLVFGPSAGIDSEMIRALPEEFDYRNTSITEILPHITSEVSFNYEAVLIYNAVQMAYADNLYTDEEKSAVRRAANAMKIEPETVDSIEHLVEMEETAARMRHALFKATR